MSDEGIKNDRPERGSFRLSSSNLIFLGCFLAAYGFYFAANFFFLTHDGRMFLIGQIGAALISPIVISFFVWLVSKRSRRASSIAFNVTLSWILFGKVLRLLGTISDS